MTNDSYFHCIYLIKNSFLLQNIFNRNESDVKTHIEIDSTNANGMIRRKMHSINKFETKHF